MSWIIQARDGKFALDMGIMCKWVLKRQLATRFRSRRLAQAVIQREESYGRTNLRVLPDLRVIRGSVYPEGQ